MTCVSYLDVVYPIDWVATTQAWDAGGVTFREIPITPPLELAATVAYIRDKVLRTLSGTDIEDEHIRRLIQAATSFYEAWTFKALRPQTKGLLLNRFPLGRIVLPRPPFISVKALAYVDATGTPQTLSAIAPSPPIYPTPPAGDVLVIPSGDYRKAELWPMPGASWPATQSGRPDAVTITFDCGVPDLAAAPQLEREIEGIALCVCDWYTNRGFNLESRYTANTFKPEHFWTKAW